MTRGRRWLVFGLKAAVSAALIAWLLHNVNLAEAAERARSLPPGAAAAVIGLLCAYVAASAIRWFEVLRAIGYRSGLAGAVRITFIGVFFNQFLPATVGGDAVRVWECYRSGLRVAKAVHSVILDRAAYLLALSLLAALGLTLWDDGRIPAGVVPVFWLVFAAAVGGTGVLAVLDRFPARLLPGALKRGSAGFAQDTRALFSNPGALAAIFATALANQALLAAAVLALARGLGIPLEWTDCACLLPAIVLVSALPISVAGWGVREYAMVTGFNYAGVATGSALVLSLTVALFYIVAALPGGVLWLARRGPPRGDLRPGASP